MWVTFLTIAKRLGWKDWLMIAAGVLILGLITTMSVRSVMDHFKDNQETREQNQDRQIREDLSEKRIQTETKISDSERKLNEELDKLPDAMPSQRRLTRACGELRDRGYQPLPVECRSEAN